MQVRTFTVSSGLVCRTAVRFCVSGSVVQVLPIWGLSIPLPAVLMITVGLYMLVLGIGLWVRYCLKVGSVGSVTLNSPLVLIPLHPLFLFFK